MTVELGRRDGFRSRTRGRNGGLRLVKNKVRLHGAGFEGPKLVCIDVQPYTTTQAPERSDVLNVGGFSDAVFHVVASSLGDGPARFAPEVKTIKV